MGLFGILADLIDPAPKWETPGQLAAALDPTTVQTPALDLIDEALVWAMNTYGARLIINMAPQEGKSQRAARDLPLWVLSHRPDTRIVIASYSQELAVSHGKKIRDFIAEYGDQLGIKIRRGDSAAKHWKVQNGKGSVKLASVKGNLTGFPADLLIIDDPYMGFADSHSPKIRQSVRDWWTGNSASRLSDGAPVVLIQTRWHEDDLSGQLAREHPDDWRVLNIPAEAEDAATDPLGRQPGEFMISARGRSQRGWEQRKREAGPKTWASLYQGRPTPLDGGVFPKDWPTFTKKEFDTMCERQANGSYKVHGVGSRTDHELIQSWDLAFKGTEASDFTVGQVWLRIGTEAYLLDMVRERMTFNESVQAVKSMSAKWPQAIGKFIEDKANGPAVINSLTGQLPGIIPVNPEGSKEARANAVAPACFAGNVHLPAPDVLPVVNEMVQELITFPAAPNDDTVDAMSQALNQLILNPLQADPVEEFDFFEEPEYRVF